jgi:hypothetical protein
MAKKRYLTATMADGYVKTIGPTAAPFSHYWRIVAISAAAGRRFSGATPSRFGKQRARRRRPPRPHGNGAGKGSTSKSWNLSRPRADLSRALACGNAAGGTVAAVRAPWQIDEIACPARQGSSRSLSQLILFNKPYGVLSQFTDRAATRTRTTLSAYVDLPGIYPAGRLDRDSEGLLLLTDDGRLQTASRIPGSSCPRPTLSRLRANPMRPRWTGYAAASA